MKERLRDYGKTQSLNILFLKNVAKKEIYDHKKKNAAVRERYGSGERKYMNGILIA